MTISYSPGILKKFTDEQLRILQNRVRDWRQLIANNLVFSGLD